MKRKVAQEVNRMGENHRGTTTNTNSVFGEERRRPDACSLRVHVDQTESYVEAEASLGLWTLTARFLLSLFSQVPQDFSLWSCADEAA